MSGFGRLPSKHATTWVICVPDDDDSVLLQVWHRQDPAGFECTYSLDFKVKRVWNSLLAPDGLTVVIVPEYSSAKCYSWNHDTAQFYPIDLIDNPVDIYAPKYSPDGRLFGCWSLHDSHVRVWDTRTGRLVSKFPTSKVYTMALSPVEYSRILVSKPSHVDEHSHRAL